MECLDFFNQPDPDDVLKSIGLIKISIGIFEKYELNKAISIIKDTIYRNLDDRFDLFITEVFSDNSIEMPYRFRYVLSKYDNVVGMWDFQFNDWLNSKSPNRNMPLQSFLNEIYDSYFDNSCVDITYGKVSVLPGPNKYNQSVMKKKIGTLKEIDGRLFLFGIAFEIPKSRL